MADAAPILAATAMPANMQSFASGPDIRTEGGRTVAYAIRVRADFKVGDRDFSGEANLHELVIMRRFYEEVNGGSVQANPSWQPAQPRLIPLTQEQLQVELKRMLENLVVPRVNSVFCVPTAFLGNEPAEQLKRLHAVMAKQLEAWCAVVERAKSRIPSPVPTNPHWLLVAAFDHITSRELEEVANLADPSRDGIGELELPEAALIEAAPTAPASAPMSLEAIQAQVNNETLPEDVQQALVAKLVAKAHLNQQQALAVATLVDLMEGAEIADSDISDAIGSKAKTMLDAVRRTLKG